MSVIPRLARVLRSRVLLGGLLGIVVAGVQAAEPAAVADQPAAAATAAATPTAAAPTAETGPPIDTEALTQQLVEGRKAFEAGRRQQAITDYYDPVIAAYHAHYDAGGKRIFCARTAAESLFYLGLAAATEDKRVSEVIDPVWSDGYLMKAYALVELGQVEEAHAALEAALALAPQNAQYLAEMGYLMQVQQRYDEAIGYFEQSAEAADFASPDEIKEVELTRAWRGKAVALIDLGRLDEAEMLLKQCLKKNRKDAKALNELAYIKGVRAKQKAAK